MNASAEQIAALRSVALGHAVATATQVALPSGAADPLLVRLISAPAFLATKFASFASRGGGDLLHRDIEDIVALVDGRAELLDEVENDIEALRSFVADSLRRLFRAGLEEQITSHLPGDWASQAREPFVLRKLRRLARMDEDGA